MASGGPGAWAIGAGLVTSVLVVSIIADLPDPSAGVVALGGASATNSTRSRSEPEDLAERVSGLAPGAPLGETPRRAPRLRSGERVRPAAPGLGREADAVFRDLVQPGLEHLISLSKTLEPAARDAESPLRELAGRVRADLAVVRGTFDDLGLAAELEGLLKILEQERDGLAPRLAAMQLNLQGGGSCLQKLLAERLARNGDSDACHGEVSSAFSSVSVVVRDIEGVWPLIFADWRRISARLSAISADPRDPRHKKAAGVLSYLHPRIRSYYDPLKESLSILTGAKAEGGERFREIEQRARLRHAELHKAMEPFFDSWQGAELVGQPWQLARDAALDLDASAKSWASGGPGARDGEAGGSRKAVRAYFTLMEALRLTRGVVVARAAS